MAIKTAKLITVKNELNLKTDSGNDHRNTISNVFVKLAQFVGLHSNTGTSNLAHNLKTDIPDV